MGRLDRSPEESVIHIAVAFDKNFITPFYVFLTSVFFHNSKNKIVFHAIASGIDAIEIDQINKLVVQNNAQIYFYELKPEDLKFLFIPDGIHLTIATYYRMFFPRLIPEYINRLLYIDTDTVVTGDLGELYFLDMPQVPVAAVPDSWPEDLHSKLGIQHKLDYFNAGVLLINLKEWEQQGITEKAIQFIKDNPEKIKLADQDALNGVLFNNWFKISNRFNLTLSDVPYDLPKSRIRQYLEDKIIIHYTTKYKPWHILCRHRLKFCYHFYKSKSPRSSERKFTDFQFSKEKLLQLFRMKIRDLYLDYFINSKIFNKLKSFNKSL